MRVTKRQTNAKPCIPCAVGILVVVAFCTITPALTAKPLEELSDALRERGISGDTVSVIIEAVDDGMSDAVPSGVDMDALAYSLAYAVEEGIAAWTDDDIAHVVQSAAAEIASMQRLGFSRQEAAQAGVRSTRNTVTDLRRGPNRPEARQSPANGSSRLPPSAIDSVRRGLNRIGRDASSIRTRIPDNSRGDLPPKPFSPDTDIPDTDSPGGPESPDIPERPE